jgi:hypothetical protein
VTIWERGQVLIETQVMASPNDMPDLVYQRIRQCCARVVNDRAGGNAGCKSATRCIIDDQHHDIGSLLGAQGPHLGECPTPSTIL